MFEGPPHQFKPWMRHTPSVPPGFLRFFVLKLLREKPMSGSEIMTAIEKETDGRWKPSPGSIYPLLAWLQDNGYTEGLPKEEDGMKRYRLIEKGEKFFEEQTKFKKRLDRKLEFLMPPPHPFFSEIWFSSHAEKLRKIREPVMRFVGAIFSLKTALEEHMTEQAIEEVGEFLNSTAEKIEEISKKLRGENK